MNYQHKESDDQMEEESKETNWSSFSMSDLEYDTSPDWNGFPFDDEFNTINNGQLKKQQIILDAADLLKRLRNESSRDSQVIPPTLFEFYDNCRNHFQLEFMDLLKALISNVETAKKLDRKSKAGNLLNLNKFELSSRLNFQQHQICQDAATVSNRIQYSAEKPDTRLRYESASRNANELCNKLKYCREDFLHFGKQERENQCKKISHCTSLDQHCVDKGKDSDAAAMHQQVHQIQMTKMKP
jgi:hypothetical protein